jgi:carbohydrate-selective porin OprB
LSSGQIGTPLIDRTKLTGDWWGTRSELIENGVNFDASTTQYYQGVASGGLQQGFRYGGRNDYFLNLDGEKAGLWRGFSVSLHGETRYGQTPDLLTGALLPVNLMMVFPQYTGTVTALTAFKVSQYLSEDLLVYGGRLNMFDTFVQPLTGATLAISNVLKDAAPNLSPLKNEEGVELFYNIAVNQWFHITPDVQVIDPYKQRADTSFVAGVRAKIDF